MDRRLSHRFVEPQYPYAVVERALAAFFDADESRLGVLRGRLKHFNRLGLPGLQVGKGARIRYSLEQASQWLIALLMAEFGTDPVVIVRLVNDRWKSVSLWVRRAIDDESKHDPVFLTFNPRLMLAALAQAKQPLDTVPWVDGFRRSDQRSVDRYSAEGWFCTRNLTNDMGRFRHYLSYLEVEEGADIAQFEGHLDAGEKA